MGLAHLELQVYLIKKLVHRHDGNSARMNHGYGLKSYGCFIKQFGEVSQNRRPHACLEIISEKLLPVTRQKPSRRQWPGDSGLCIKNLQRYLVQGVGFGVLG